MKKVLSIIMALILVFSLCGCKKTTKKTDKIVQDLKNDVQFSETYKNYDIKSVDVEKRMTEEKTDIVYATVNIVKKDKSLEGTIPIVITYSLYDKGWLIDSWTYDGRYSEDYFIIKKAPDIPEEKLLEIFKRDYGSGEISNFEVKNKEIIDEYSQISYTAAATVTHKYVVYEMEAKYSFYINGCGEWEYDYPAFETTVIEENWDIKGNYNVNNSNGSVCIPSNDPHMLTSITHYGETVKISKEKKNSTEQDIRVYSGNINPKNKNYRFELFGDFTKANIFVLFAGASKRSCQAIFVGKDNLAIVVDDEVDKNHSICYLEVRELVPIQ